MGPLVEGRGAPSSGMQLDMLVLVAQLRHLGLKEDTKGLLKDMNL